MLKPVSKPKATQSAFAAQEITLNKKEILDTSNSLDIIETGAIAIEKSKTISKKRNKKRKTQNSNWGRNNSAEDINQSSLHDRNLFNCFCSPRSNCISNRQMRNPYASCDSFSHNFSKCYLALGKDSNLTTDVIWEKFQNNMKVASFRKQVDNLQKTLQSESNINK